MSALTRLDIPVAGVIVNALTPPGCSRCRAAAAAEQRVVRALTADLAASKHAPAVIIGVPASAPPPRGVPALTRWPTSWTRTRRSMTVAVRRGPRSAASRALR